MPENATPGTSAIAITAKTWELVELTDMQTNVAVLQFFVAFGNNWNLRFYTFFTETGIKYAVHRLSS